MDENQPGERLLSLAKKWLAGSITAEEKTEFDLWYNSFDDISHQKSAQETLDELELRMQEQIFAKAGIKQSQQEATKRLWPRMAAAAAILIFLSISCYFFLNKPTTQQTAKNQTHDILPGSNQATLTLANGQKITLTKGLNGKLAQQGNALVRVNSGNAIAYTADDAYPDNVKVEYNTLSTKKGEQSPYPLILADGTKVWLNSASSITFPTEFNGHNRKVNVTGEAYFEVTHNAAMPFSVTVKDQTIVDIGTHFNINAYDDEPLWKTTLLEGSIKVSRLSKSIVLTPGQQAVASNASALQLIKGVNTKETIAWHHGLFEFHDASIQTVMRQLARWYDVEVIYEGKPTDRLFSGKIYRNITALKVSDILSYSNIHFRIEGKKIIVMP